MNYFDRAAQNSMVDQAKYFSARNAQDSNSAIGTPMGIDGATGRTLMVAGDGITRTSSIASSNQLGITSPFAKGYSDGRSA